MKTLLGKFLLGAATMSLMLALSATDASAADRRGGDRDGRRDSGRYDRDHGLDRGHVVRSSHSYRPVHRPVYVKRAYRPYYVAAPRVVYVERDYYPVYVERDYYRPSNSFSFSFGWCD